MEVFCRDEFQRLELTIPKIALGSKSVIYSPDKPAEFLGLELALINNNYELRLSAKQVSKIRDDLLQFGSIKELLSRKITFKTLGPLLAAKRNGYLAAYDVCSNLKEVNNNLVNIEQRVLRKIYKELGINLNTINNETRSFLGLRSD